MRKIITALVATTALGAAAAPAAEASCSQWDLSRGRLVQSNGWKVALPYQSGNRLSGKARTWHTVDNVLTGTLRGYVTGNRVRFTVVWSNGTAGVYQGTIDDDGFVEGTTSDRFNPRSKATFHMRGYAGC